MQQRPLPERDRTLMGAVTVKVVSVDNASVLMECTECGPLGIRPPGEVHEAAYEHLAQTHDCDMTSVRIDPLDGEDQ
jgi:hypothetical protein